MQRRISYLVSWFAGLLGLVAVIWYFQLSSFFSQLAKVGVGGSLGWLFLTLCARLLLVEITVLPIRALGFSLRRSDAFWIGWIRTFANQIVPLSGLAVFTREIRRKANIPWSGIVALSTPMLLFAAAGVSLIGLLAVASNVTYLGASAVPMSVTFTIVGSGSIIAATHAAWLIERLPITRFVFAEESAAAFRRLSEGNGLILGLVGLHAVAILVRGTRIWLLFLLVGADMSLSEAFLVVVIAESAALFQITPGGLGLREGAIIGSAVLLHILPDLGAVVALIDRLFIVTTTTFLAIPGYVLLRRSQDQLVSVRGS